MSLTQSHTTSKRPSDFRLQVGCAGGGGRVGPSLEGQKGLEEPQGQRKDGCARQSQQSPRPLLGEASMIFSYLLNTWTSNIKMGIIPSPQESTPSKPPALGTM